MQILIDENLKRLRKQQGMTQETLAETLHVAFQTVSKWERGDCLPDIALLPALANVFGVTIDELMGMDAERKQAALQETFASAHMQMQAGEYQQAADCLREALRFCPSHEGLRSDLAMAMAIAGETDEAIVLCEKILENSANEKLRATTRAALCFLYESAGNHARALTLANTLPHLRECREAILPQLTATTNFTKVLRNIALGEGKL